MSTTKTETTAAQTDVGEFITDDGPRYWMHCPDDPDA